MPFGASGPLHQVIGGWQLSGVLVYQTGPFLTVVAPGTDQLWEALRALVVIGTRDDLDSVRRYERAEPNVADRVRQQAVETDKAILRRAK